MTSVGLQGKIIALLIVLSVIPLTLAGHLLTDYSIDALTDATQEGVTDVVDAKATHYGRTFHAFKQDVEAVSGYIPAVWNASHPRSPDASRVWISPNGTGYPDYAGVVDNGPWVTGAFDVLIHNKSAVELAYFGTSSPVIFFNKPMVATLQDIRPFDHRTRPWYTMARDANDTVWTSVYVDAHTGKLVTTVATPVYIDGRFAGVVAFDLLLETIQQDILDLQFSGSGYAVLADSQGDVIVHPDYTVGDRRWNETFAEVNVCNMSGLASVGAAMVNEEEGIASVTINGRDYYVAYAHVPEINGSLAFFVGEEQVTGPISSLRRQMYLGVLTLAVIVAALGVYFARSVTRPLERLTEGAERVARGDLDHVVDHPRGDDEIARLTRTFNDMIDELRASQRELRHSEKKYRDLFESSRDAIYVTTRNGRFLDVNPAAEELWGYPRDELLQLQAQDLYVDEEDRAAFREEIEEKGYVEDYEVQTRRRDGDVITCLETATVKRDEDGDVIGYQGFLRDITHIRAAERKIEAYNSLMRHDVTNRCQIAQSYLEFLLETDLSGEQRGYAEKAMDMLISSREMVQKIRAINRAQQPHELKQTDVDAVARRAIEMHQHQLEDGDIEIAYDGEPVTVAADDMLQHVFSNLIHNAIAHADCDAITISIEASDDTCTVRVADDGVGIPPELEDTIFNWRTKRADSSGSGLGLHLVKVIVDSYGGTIQVESQPGEGTTFVIRLQRWRE